MNGHNPMDWANWYKLYDAGQGLSVRLRIVQEQIQAALDKCQQGPIWIVSVCAGDGRDVIEVLSGHSRRGDVLASLIDNHEPSLERGRAAAAAAGLGAQIEFICADATRTESYLGLVPADLIIISGVLGHVSEDWLPRFMGGLPMLCRAGGFVIWNRHQVINRGAEHIRLIQESLRASGFDEVHFSATSPTGFAIGRARFDGTTVPLEPGRLLFEFKGLDRLLQQQATNGKSASAAGVARDASVGTGSDYGQEESLPVCFERQVSLHPDRTALGSGEWRPTYAELNDRASRAAAAIMTRGGVAGDRVALLMQHDTPLIAAMLAVLKAGRIVVVLNPTDPPARLLQVLTDAEPAILLTDVYHCELAGQCAVGGCGVLLFEEVMTAEPAPVMDMIITPDAPAFLIYTSGSTGPPKGVLQSHGNVVHKALRVSRGLELQAEERIILLGSLSGGQGVNTTLCALLNGVTLCPFPIMNIGVTGLADWLVDHGITVFVSAASVFRHFVRTLELDRRFPCTRMVWLASEPVTSDDVESCWKHFADDCVLFHTLASSETGVIAQWRVSRLDSVPEGRLPVGRAAAGIELLLLDENGREVTRGLTGEIAIRSKHLATGYWRNDALTAGHFSELEGSEGVREFRSGDRGRLTADGLLMFMGRSDTRVNVHGYRVELSEIEEALLRLPAVEKGVVAMHQRPTGDEQVAAYIMLRPGYALTVDALRDALRLILPGHMIPTAFVFLESLPLTPHGKVDREVLRQISPSARERLPADEPATATEKLLAEIWSAVFGCGPAGRHDHFFDLGGDSLTAAVMAAKIHAALRVQLDLRVFAEHPTLTALAAFLDAGQNTAGTVCDLPLVRASRDQPLPLSFHQERAWKHAQTSEGSGGYGSAGCQLLRGPLDVRLLRESITFLTSRHEILRTTFPAIDGNPVQLVHPPASVPVPLIDLSGDSNPEEEAARHFREEARRTMELGQGPLIRFMLFRLRDGEHQFFRIGHHIISDAWSWDIFFDELGLVYEAKLRGDNIPFPEFEPLGYGDYAVWQRGLMRRDGPGYQEEVSWWRNQLSNPPGALDLPFRRPEPMVKIDAGEGSIRLDFDPAISQRLRQIGREGNATYYAVRLAAYVALLADTTGREDLVLGTYVTNRNRVETQKMFGFFANLVTMRFRLDDTLTFREWLSQVGKLAGEFQKHGEIPYEQLCEELRGLSVITPEIRAIFSSSSRSETISFGGLELTKVVSRRTRMLWGFDLHFYQGTECDQCRVVFDARIYDPAGVRAFIDRLFRFLDEASREPDVTIARLLTASGPRGVVVATLDEMDRGLAWTNVEQSLANCFKTVALTQLSKKAIGSGSWQPTYARLNATANRIAHLILSSGAPGDRVALLMQHDGPLMAALLGVLKAGRVVVVLHAGGPPARLGRICHDAEPKIIIADALHREAAAVLAGGTRQVICFDEAFVNDTDANPVMNIAPDAAAFLFYTSGSSGQPKGVVQTHRQLLHAVRGYSRAFRLRPKDRICLLGSLGGGQGVMTTLCALLNGATLYPYEIRDRGVAAMPGWLAARKISVFISAATIFRQMVKIMPEGAEFPQLRLVRLGAEPALRSDLEACRRIFSEKCEFFHVLSSTETGNVTLFPCKDVSGLEDGVLPVGWPVPGKSVLLLREDGTEAPTGESGEIAVRSSYLSPGYWRDPAKTSAAFQNVPGSEERIFRTGDLGCWRADGALIHLGRADTRQKVLGNRVEIGEVESVLRDQPQVSDVVVAMAGANGSAGQLVAWVVARQAGELDEIALRAALRKSLSDSMIPSRIIRLESLPLAANGKPDRQVLLSQLDLLEKAPAVPPRTSMEKMIAAHWSHALGLPVAGVYDNFFESGGDSLSAVDLILSLSKALGMEISGQALINHPTIAQLAEVIEAGRINPERQPWFRLWNASLLSLREGGSAAPLLFIPGGYMGENELLVFAGLTPGLGLEHPVLAARLNLHARRVIPPRTLHGIARAIGQSYLARHAGRIPVVVGECQACPLALEVAQWLTRKLGTAPLLVLLDPWHPRTQPSRDDSHPAAIRRYRYLLGQSNPRAYAGRAHVICATETGRLSVCREWWGARLGPDCGFGEVPGDHQTYIRQHRKNLVEAINNLLSLDAVPATRSDGVRLAAR